MVRSGYRLERVSYQGVATRRVSRSIFNGGSECQKNCQLRRLSRLVDFLAQFKCLAYNFKIKKKFKSSWKLKRCVRVASCAESKPAAATATCPNKYSATTATCQLKINRLATATATTTTPYRRTKSEREKKRCSLLPYGSISWNFKTCPPFA